MGQLKKVTMNLTEQDFENTQLLSDTFHTRNKAEAVSAALCITRFLTDVLRGGNELILRHKNGDIEKIIIPGFPG